MTCSIWASDNIMLVAIPNKLDNLDPFKATTAQQTFILPLIYESLLATEINGETRPNLIREWTINEKEKTLSFKIRSDVSFSDGSPLTLKDVVESFRLICQHPVRSQELSLINGCTRYDHKKFGVQIIGDSIKVSISKHPSYLLSKFAGENILVLKKSKGAYIGTGPLKFKELNAKKLMLVKNSLHRFWKSPTKFSEVHFVFVDEHSVDRFVNNESVHIASMYLSSTASSIQSSSYTTINHAPNVVQALVLNSHVEPFNNQKLRAAIHKDLKKSHISICSPSSRTTNGFIPRGIGGSLSASENHLEGFSLKDVILSKRVNVKIHRHLGRKNICEEKILQNIFMKYNLGIDFVYHDNYDSLDKAVLDSRVDGFLELYVFKSRDASAHLKNMVPENKNNFYKFNSNEVKLLLDQAWNTSNLSSRFSYYREINKLIQKSSVLIDLYAIGHSNIINKCLLKHADNVSYYNPNSFLFLFKLDFNSTCQLKVSP